MKTKVQKRTEAKKNAEAVKAKRKAARTANAKPGAANPAHKGKSLVPQAKKKK
jgi:hypothetical protein